jgi:hypothetical protein
VHDPASRKMLMNIGIDPLGATLQVHDTFIKLKVGRRRQLAGQAGIEPQ